MEDEKPIRRRKSLAVDEETYDKLNKICSQRRRSKIQQLQVLSAPLGRFLQVAGLRGRRKVARHVRPVDWLLGQSQPAARAAAPSAAAAACGRERD